MSGDRHFNPHRIFIALLVLTALEVAWGVGGGGEHLQFPKMMLWGGLLLFAFFKGWLIAIYFMHLKFEGWVVKSLVLPTPFLIMVIMGYVGNDVANDPKDSHVLHPIGTMLDPSTGVMVDLEGDVVNANEVQPNVLADYEKQHGEEHKEEH